MSEPSDEHFRVLVVEGDVFQRVCISDELRDRGFEILEAGDGAAALSLLSSEIHIDAVFTEVYLRGSLNGFDLAQLAASTRFGSLSVVLTSAHPATKVQAEGTGIPFVAKLYKADDVAAALYDVLERSSTGRARGADKGPRALEA